MEKNYVCLYGFKPEDDPIYDEATIIGEFPTYEEAKKEGERLIQENKLKEFDTYVI